MTFQWDDNKNSMNIKKHGVSFEEASSAFNDDEAILIGDPDHSADEERFLLLGLSRISNLLVVCHCYRGNADIIRIISARLASKNEAAQYYKRIGGH